MSFFARLLVPLFVVPVSAVAKGLTANGVANRIDGDDLHVEGCNGTPPGGGTVICHYDHRIAMSFLIMGMASRQPVKVDDGCAIATSFPNFTAIMNRIGGHITPIHGEGKSHFRPMVVAIDGPAASGKSSTARAVAIDHAAVRSATLIKTRWRNEARIASIDRRTAGKQCVSLCRSAIIGQRV